jgi:hypothetical protein
VQDAEGIAIINCTFQQTGGNAVFFSNHVVDSVIYNSEFVYTGDSAIAFIGSAQLADGSAPTFPWCNTVANNHIHEVGIYGKQTSCFTQALAGQTTLQDNVCYNGPRAGFNGNDGFFGGNVMSGNLVFNMVRETQDHGPANTWDRQPFWTANGVDDGFNHSIHGVPVSLIRIPDLQTRNFIINGYAGEGVGEGVTLLPGKCRL